MKELIKFSEKEIGRSKPSKILPLLALIGSEWGLNLSKDSDYKIAKKILINSIKNN